MPNDATLQKTKKNEVLMMLRGAGLRPEEFGWSTKEYVERSRYGPTRNTISVLSHGAERYYCEFLPNGGLRYSPGEEDAVDFQQVEGEWSDIKEAIGVWLRYLQRQLSAPDLWATIGQESALSDAASSATLDNQPFTIAEQHLIAAKLDEIKGHILENQQFAADQVELVEERFRYFVESSSRMGRKDWLNVLYGGLITVIVGVALAPDAARSLLRLAAAAFQSLWGMAQGQLP